MLEAKELIHVIVEGLKDLLRPTRRYLINQRHPMRSWLTRGPMALLKYGITRVVAGLSITGGESDMVGYSALSKL
jgi:hypothetical protein